jgi:hypothetical protein
MSRVRFMSTGSTVADCHAVDGTPFLGFPWRYSETPIADLAPLAVAQDDLIEWWWRIKTLNLTFTTTGDLATMPSGSMTLTRLGGSSGLLAVTSESDLCYPGADRTESGDAYGWTATQIFPDFDGLGNDCTVLAIVRLCTYGLSISGLENVVPAALENRAYYDAGLGKWKPTLRVFMSVDVSPGAGQAMQLRAASFAWTYPTDFILGTANFLTANGGGALTMRAYDLLRPGHATQMSVNITALSWYPYANDAGEAVWNTGTGAQLMNPRQDPV